MNNHRFLIILSLVVSCKAGGLVPGGTAPATGGGPTADGTAAAEPASDGEIALNLAGQTHLQIWEQLATHGHQGDLEFKITAEEEKPSLMRFQKGGQQTTVTVRQDVLVMIDGPVSDKKKPFPAIVGMPVAGAITALTDAGIIEFALERVDTCAKGTVCATFERKAGDEASYYAGRIEIGK